MNEFYVDVDVTAYSPALRQADRDRIAADTAAYLANGGTICHIGNGVSNAQEYSSWGKSNAEIA